jgi:hypothetical protein
MEQLPDKLIPMKLFLILFSLPVFSQVHLLTDKKLLEKTKIENQKLREALSECKPHEYRHSHALVTKHPLISKIYGIQKDQSCLFTQTLPHGDLKTCTFSAKHRLTIKTLGQEGLNQLMTDPKVCKDSGSNQ